MRDIFITGVHGGWSDWADWGECSGSADCSDGKETRERFCNNPKPGPGGNLCVGSESDLETESRDCITKCRNGKPVNKKTGSVHLTFLCKQLD